MMAAILLVERGGCGGGVVERLICDGLSEQTKALPDTESAERVMVTVVVVERMMCDGLSEQTKALPDTESAESVTMV